MIRLLVLIAAFVPSLAFAACEPGEVRIRIAATPSPQTAVRDRPARGLADAFDRQLQGKACAELVDGDLASLRTDAEMALPALTRLAETATAWRVFDLPFAFRGIEAVERFRAGGAGAELEASATAAGAVPLGLLHAGMSHFLTRRPLIVAGDMTGRKIARDGSRYAAMFLSAAGAPPQTVPRDEWETALGDGRLDGVSMGWQDIARTRNRDAAQHVLATAHRFDGYAIVAAASWWRAQPEALRTDIVAIIDNAVAEANAFQGRQIDSARRAVLRGKTTVRVPTRKQRRAWKALAERAVAPSLPITDLQAKLDAANAYP